MEDLGLVRHYREHQERFWKRGVTNKLSQISFDLLIVNTHTDCSCEHFPAECFRSSALGDRKVGFLTFLLRSKNNRKKVKALGRSRGIGLPQKVVWLKYFLGQEVRWKGLWGWGLVGSFLSTARKRTVYPEINLRGLEDYNTEAYCLRKFFMFFPFSIKFHLTQKKEEKKKSASKSKRKSKIK